MKESLSNDAVVSSMNDVTGELHLEDIEEMNLRKLWNHIGGQEYQKMWSKR